MTEFDTVCAYLLLIVNKFNQFGAAVGGVVMPANNFSVVAPWLAIIGLVGCIGTVALVTKKRRQ